MPRSVASIQGELDAIDAAIAKAVQAQSLTVNGRTVTSQNLDALTRRRDQLQAQLDNQQQPRQYRSCVDGLGA